MSNIEDKITEQLDRIDEGYTKLTERMDAFEEGQSEDDDGSEMESIREEVKVLKDEHDKQKEEALANLKALEEENRARQDELEEKITNSATRGPEPVKTPGQLFVSDKTYLNALDKGESFFKREGVEQFVSMRDWRAGTYALKAQSHLNLTVVGDPTCGDADAPCIPTPRICIRDLVPASTHGARIKEFYTGDVIEDISDDCIAKGDPKPEDVDTITLAQAAMCKVGRLATVTYEDLSDIQGLRSYIDNRLRTIVDLSEEDKFLTADTGGTGTYDGLTITADPYDEGTFNKTTPIDRISGMETQVEVNGFMPTAIVVNPVDWHNIRTSRADAVTADDEAGEYLYVQPGQCDDGAQLWCLRVCSSVAVPAGNALVGAFNMAQILDGNLLGEFGTRIFTGFSDTQIATNELTIVVERRSLIYTACPDAFVYGTLEPST